MTTVPIHVLKLVICTQSIYLCLYVYMDLLYFLGREGILWGGGTANIVVW